MHPAGVCSVRQDIRLRHLNGTLLDCIGNLKQVPGIENELKLRRLYGYGRISQRVEAANAGSLLNCRSCFLVHEGTQITIDNPLS